jgi:hypothetical protein
VDELDTIDAHPTYDPTTNFKFSLDPTALTASERAAAGLEASVDDIELALDGTASKTGQGAL